MKRIYKLFFGTVILFFLNNAKARSAEVTSEFYPLHEVMVVDPRSVLQHFQNNTSIKTDQKNEEFNFRLIYYPCCDECCL
jgi:hypothetical protein